MHNRADHILDMLDNALQTPAPSHTGFGAKVPSGICWRCLKHAAGEDGTMCLPCRAYLQCDSDEDPAAGADDEPPEWFERWWALLDDDEEPERHTTTVQAVRYSARGFFRGPIGPRGCDLAVPGHDT